jgi:hypothetical protein
MTRDDSDGRPAKSQDVGMRRCGPAKDPWEYQP